RRGLTRGGAGGVGGAGGSATGRGLAPGRVGGDPEPPPGPLGRTAFGAFVPRMSRSSFRILSSFWSSLSSRWSRFMGGPPGGPTAGGGSTAGAGAGTAGRPHRRTAGTTAGTGRRTTNGRPRADAAGAGAEALELLQAVDHLLQLVHALLQFLLALEDFL